MPSVGHNAGGGESVKNGTERGCTMVGGKWRKREEMQSRLNFKEVSAKVSQKS